MLSITVLTANFTGSYAHYKVPADSCSVNNDRNANDDDNNR